MEPRSQSQTVRTLGVVTGLASEAVVANALLGDDTLPVAIVCAGADTRRAGQLAKQLVDDGAGALLSFGIAGAVDPALSSGDLIVADSVLIDDVGISEHCICDAAWLDALHSSLAETRTPYRGGMLIGSHRLFREANDKEAIFEITQAVAVDMESGAVARVAAEAGIPFLAVRAIADTARDDLPALVENAVKPDGMPAVGRAIAGLIRRPWELPAVLRVARQSEAALSRLKTLGKVKAALFGGF